MQVNEKIIEELIGHKKLLEFNKMRDLINEIYDMDNIWNDGGKKWDYEYKFRKSGKTLCAFYFKKDILGLMIIFGKNERDKVEEMRSELGKEIIWEYDNAKTYHDGKWVMFNINNTLFDDLKKLLLIKRKPNRKE